MNSFTGFDFILYLKYNYIHFLILFFPFGAHYNLFYETLKKAN